MKSALRTERLARTKVEGRYERELTTRLQAEERLQQEVERRIRAEQRVAELQEIVLPRTDDVQDSGRIVTAKRPKTRPLIDLKGKGRMVDTNQRSSHTASILERAAGTCILLFSETSIAQSTYRTFSHSRIGQPLRIVSLRQRRRGRDHGLDPSMQSEPVIGQVFRKIRTCHKLSCLGEIRSLLLHLQMTERNSCTVEEDEGRWVGDRYTGGQDGEREENVLDIAGDLLESNMGIIIIKMYSSRVEPID